MILNTIDPVTGKKYKDITTEEWFNNNPFSIDIFNRKYKLTEDETPPMAFWRCCQFAAQAEEKEESQEYWAERWFKEIVDDWWMPAGSILSSAGKEGYKISLMNCTGIQIPDDTLESIADSRGTVQKMAAYRQGIGINFSNLRPKGMAIKNSSRISQGACHWMKSFDQIGYEVGQRGRIPALLEALSCEHLDIEEFINLKADNIDSVRNANISIMVTDRFMEAAMREESLEISFTSTNETKTKTIYPHKLLKLVAKNMYESGEPGIQFIDTISKYSNSNYVGFPVVASNACCFTLSDNTYIATAVGLKNINTLKNTDIQPQVISDTRIYKTNKIGTTQTPGLGLYPASKLFYVGEQPCIKLRFNNGMVHEVSEDHLYPVVRDDNTFVCKKAKDILKSDKLYFQEQEGIFGQPITAQDYELGFLIGWASVSKQKYASSLTLDISEQNLKAVPKLLTLLKSITGRDYHTNTDDKNNTYIQSTDLYKVVTSYIKDFTEAVPRLIMEGSRDIICGYLSACISMKSTAWTSDRWAFDTQDRDSKKEVRISFNPNAEDLGIGVKTLLANFGIFSSSTGMRNNKQVILRGQDLLKFIDKIGFIEYTYCCEYLSDIPRDYVWGERILKVVEKENIGIQPVYCLEQLETHSLIVNGIVTNNSEQMLDNQGVCLLASTNMGRYSTDYEKRIMELHDISESMVRFLDNINTLELRDNKSASPIQRNSVENLRRIGCGITNSVEYLFKQELDYNTEEGIESISEFVEDYCGWLYNHSFFLGEEKGNFKAFDREKYCQSPFIQYIEDKYEISLTAMRNCALVSIAPSGSISTQFRNFIMSYGVEPAFGHYYWKRTRVSGTWKYYFTVPQTIQDYMNKIGHSLNMCSVTIEDDFAGTIGKPIKDIIDTYCDINITSMSNVDIDNKINLLEKLYKNVDASISVTNNLSANSTVEDVEAMIYKAYRKGIKSFTCYHETGKRLGIVETVPFKERAIQLTKDGVKLSTADLDVEELKSIGVFEQKEQPISFEGIDREKTLKARVHRTTIQGTPYYVFMGFQQDVPYEVFLYKEEDGGNIPNTCMEGTITKKKNKYEYVSGEFVIPNIAKYPTGTEVLTTRFVSMLLRHRISIDQIIDQLQKSKEYITDFASGLMRVLRKYESEKQESGKVCPLCGNKSIIRIDGCYSCTNKTCGYQGACE